MFHHEKSLFGDKPLPSRSKPPPKKAELAPIEIRDFAYRKLIALSPSTRFSEIIEGPKGLRCRQILNFEDFGSLPPTSEERRELANIIRASINRNFPDYVRKFRTSICGVPGFWIDEKGKSQLWSDKNYSFPLMLIPYRNSTGMIQACQIRFMNHFPETEVRYVWLSTPKKSGSISCGSPIHFVRPLTESISFNKPFLVTEGALKASTIQNHFPEFNVVAVGGISSSHKELIKALRFLPLIIAFDNDYSNNSQVLRQLVRLICARFSDSLNHNYNPNLSVLSWSSDFNGIDEAIINNQEIEIVSFSHWITKNDLSLNPEIADIMCYNII
ncbi:MAG: hypothetical protein HC846_01140 [Blastocatellia bacterium]|nr:hypothetical protein [Blastocatellia bacterium]